LDWLGVLTGDWRVEELPELFELLELLELFESPELLELFDELDDLDDLEEELDEPVPAEDVPDEPVEPVDPVEPELPDDEVLLDDVPESLTEACVVAPGRTAITAPATATLAKDAVTVVAVSRRLPCSRSATARASCRALA
jgi:hypothetical protein